VCEVTFRTYCPQRVTELLHGDVPGKTPDVAQLVDSRLIAAWTVPMTTGSTPRASDPPGLDLGRLADWLAAHPADGIAGPPLGVELIAGGRSNLTYRVRFGGGSVVLRRPPLGHVLATAHDMSREYRVISALTPTAVPVPTALALCPDPEVMGAPFYLMADVPGTVYRTRRQTDQLTPRQRRDLAFSMIDTLRDLHAIDPAAVGLGDFGRPDGYLPRQVKRWAAQLDSSRSRDLPGIDELRDRLLATVPAPRAAGIVHGDYRLDNLIVDPDTGAVAAVLDWEMATLGDPLADLGLLLTYWDALGGGSRSPDRPGPPGAAAAGPTTPDNPVADGLGEAAGFPSGAELIARYGADVAELGWYVGLGCYKLAVICEGIHYRYTLGQTVGAGFDRMGSLVAPLVARGISVTGRSAAGPAPGLSVTEG
jgi:aminoglycoside phosphotransferase (APT) family kinase protein